MGTALGPLGEVSPGTGTDRPMVPLKHSAVSPERMFRLRLSVCFFIDSVVGG